LGHGGWEVNDIIYIVITLGMFVVIAAAVFAFEKVK
jgi:hypothetical protein